MEKVLETSTLGSLNTAIRHNLNQLWTESSIFQIHYDDLQAVLLLSKIHETTLVSSHQSKIDAGLHFSLLGSYGLHHTRVFI